MFYSIWLLAAALAGWAAGKIAGDDGFETLTDIVLGITGAFVVRWSLEKIGISLEDAVSWRLHTGQRRAWDVTIPSHGSSRARAAESTLPSLKMN